MSYCVISEYEMPAPEDIDPDLPVFLDCSDDIMMGEGNEAEPILFIDPDPPLQVWQSVTTPVAASTPKKSPKSVRVRPIQTMLAGYDSGSDDEDGVVNDGENDTSAGQDGEEECQEMTDTELLITTRRIRERIIDEVELSIAQAGINPVEVNADEDMKVEGGDRALGETDVTSGEGGRTLEAGDGALAQAKGAEEDVQGGIVRIGGERCATGEFAWSADFSTFSGKAENYIRTPGPLTSCTAPTDLFLLVWDLPIVTYLVEQYNKYAIDFINSKSEVEDGLSNHLMGWKETTVDEMYRFLSVLNFMAIGKFNRVNEYWNTGILGMPAFRKIMNRNRFMFMLRFLHFVDNDTLLPSDRSSERKIAKIKPIITHCNEKFASLYRPSRHLSLDESLLLWKGRLSWKQSNRLKAAKIGIKSFDLCEAETGYLLKCLLYTGKETCMTEKAIDGFMEHTAKVVLELMDGYLDVGHCLVMDNWYNQLPLTRHLKSRKTDVIGTLKRQRLHVPLAIKNMDEKGTQRGEQMSLHCGDIAIVAWKDLRLVTTISTYHNAAGVRCRRSNITVTKPKVVADYNKYMGGVDLKDQKLSSYHFERKRGLKWYMKVFRRLMNTSLLNCFIIYNKQASSTRLLTHRQFRLSVAEGLLVRFPQATIARPQPVPVPHLLRLDGRDHYPDRTVWRVSKTGRSLHARMRCVVCSTEKRRTEVGTKCSKCNVALCLGACFRKWHTNAKLKIKLLKQ